MLIWCTARLSVLDHDRGSLAIQRNAACIACRRTMHIEEAIRIPVGATRLRGDLALVPWARGIVAFVHGSGSSRLSPRNRAVAQQLNRAGLSTLLFDLLTSEEEAIDARTRALRFDIELLAQRLLCVVDWLGEQPRTAELRIGLFGASTGAAAALQVAAQRPRSIGAVVSRGGRPDLASVWLHRVRAPTLLIVGAFDPEVLTLNEQAVRQLRAPCTLRTVAGATHLFEEPGALEQVAHLAADWFASRLGAPRALGPAGAEPC